MTKEGNGQPVTFKIDISGLIAPVNQSWTSALSTCRSCDNSAASLSLADVSLPRTRA